MGSAADDSRAAPAIDQRPSASPSADEVTAAVRCMLALQAFNALNVAIGNLHAAEYTEVAASLEGPAQRVAELAGILWTRSPA